LKKRRPQRGYIYRRGHSWFVRFFDDKPQPDGSLKRVQVSEKLPVQFSDEYRTKKSVREFADDILRPLNQGLVNPESAQELRVFIADVYLPWVKANKRPSTLKACKDIFRIHLKARLGNISVRKFRTFDGQRLLDEIARQAVTKGGKPLTHASLMRIKSFLSGVFSVAKRLGVLDTINPMQGTLTPTGERSADTYAYSLAEVEKILAALPEAVAGEPFHINEQARTVVLAAACSGLRKSELMGLRWRDFSGSQLSVSRSILLGKIQDPKSDWSRASVPVVERLADALEAHRVRLGKILAQPDSPIFQNGTGKPLSLDNLAKRAIQPAIEKCSVCRKSEADHPPEGHLFKLDESLRWHGWHAFRRFLGTNLVAMGVDGRTVQAILRHGTLAVTMAHYVKSTDEARVSAMDLLSSEMQKNLEKNSACTILAPKLKGRIN